MKLKNILNEAPIAKVDDGDPFPTMSKWWTYPKEKIMSFVYWTQRQLPPSDENLIAVVSAAASIGCSSLK